MAQKAVLELDSLAQAIPGLSAALAQTMYEAAVMCLELHRHESGVSCKVRDLANALAETEVRWTGRFSDRIRRTFGDTTFAVEMAAAGLASERTKRLHEPARLCDSQRIQQTSHLHGGQMINLPKDVEQLHREAMAFFDDARVARLYGDHETRLHLTRKAFAKERAAADLMVGSDNELSRSVLHRSAASLAWQCQMYDEAKALIHRGLEGNPPGDIKRELNELLEMVEAALENSSPAPIPQPEPALAL